jgi:hypothetical protein
MIQYVLYKGYSMNLSILIAFSFCISSLGYANPYSLSLVPNLKDKGIFNDLDSQAVYAIPSWLPPNTFKLYTHPQSHATRVGLYYGSTLLHYFELEQGQLKTQDRTFLTSYTPTLNTNTLTSLPPSFLNKHDQDQDGIEDGLDLYLGTRKVALNAAEYRQGYEHIRYPNGEIKRDHGVCTDVIVRAFRNAGWDLQKLLYLDMRRSPRSYGLKAGKKPNRHIEHRRVRRLIIYFKRHFKALPIEFSSTQTGNQVWLPGDLLFMDTFGVGYPTHVGLVSGRLGEDGEPLITNNWTDGYSTREMSLRQSATYTHRFRITLKK